MLRLRHIDAFVHGAARRQRARRARRRVPIVREESQGVGERDVSEASRVPAWASSAYELRRCEVCRVALPSYRILTCSPGCYQRWVLTVRSSRADNLELAKKRRKTETLGAA